MQDHSPPTRQNLLATHGRTIHWVKSGSDALRLRCPLYTQQRTFLDAVPMSDKGHYQTLDRLFDQLVRNAD